jgi:cyclophilin family peptidyl-prolyl cis-trans isomerase
MSKATQYQIEPLESRRLLSVTIVATLGNVSVAPNSMATSIDLGTDFSDPQVTGTTVLVRTNVGNLPLEMSDSVVPITVANFLRYVNAGLYNGTIFDRTVASFIDQAGGFKTDGTAITNFGTIQNEFHASNTRGTVAMVKQGGDPNSASNEWFVNVANNSGTLDSQNGGFTVFAQVLYNGMSTADAINSLPTVDGSLLTPALPAKPDDPLPVLSASGGVAANNLVVINSAAVVPALTFGASSDNPSLVSASIGPDGHTLVLSYTPGQKGVAHVTVNATDLGGVTASQSFRVNVGTTGDLITVTAGKGGAKAVTVQPPGGAALTLVVRGPGAAELQILGDGVQQSTQKNGTLLVTGTTLSVFGLKTTNTGPSTSINLTTRRGAVATVAGITTDAAVGSINGKTVDLTGNLTAGGAIRSVTFHGVNNTDTVSGNAVLTVPSITTLAVMGDLSNVILDVTGSGVRSLSIGGTMSHDTIETIGSMGSLTAANISNTQIYAAVAALAPGQMLPDLAAQFTAAATINLLKDKGAFSSTNIAADKLLNLSLGKIQTNNAGVPFGLAAHLIGAVSGVNAANGKKVALHKLNDPAALPAIESSLGLKDFTLKVL